MHMRPPMPDDTDWSARATPAGIDGTRRPWCEEEDRRLRALCLEGRSQREIGRRLGRAVSSVGCRIRVLGCPVRPPEAKRRRSPRPSWPADLRYEDDPRAASRAPAWRGPTMASASAVGCAAALVADEA